MKKKLAILSAVLLCITGAGSTANAAVFVEVGDRPFFLHGPGYWGGRYYYVWVPGHWGPHHRVWIHGHYRRR